MIDDVCANFLRDLLAIETLNKKHPSITRFAGQKIGALHRWEMEGLVCVEHIAYLHPSFADLVYITDKGKQALREWEAQFEIDLSLELEDETNSAGNVKDKEKDSGEGFGRGRNSGHREPESGQGVG